MSRPWQMSFGLLLTALAGYIDAIGFIQLNGLYTSFMSGNTTQLGVSLAHGAFGQAVMPALLILVFLIGSTIGSGLWMATPARWGTPVVMAYETLLIVGALALGLQLPELGLSPVFMAFAMGSQNAVLGSVQGFRAGTTFVTGALFGLGQKLAAALTGTGPAFGWIGDATVWLALMTGALAGTAAYTMLGISALIVPASVAGLLAITATLLAALRPIQPAV